MEEPGRVGQALGAVSRRNRQPRLWLAAVLVGWAVLGSGSGPPLPARWVDGWGLPAAWAGQNQVVGHVQRGWLGVVVQEITPALARALGIPEARGVLVVDVAFDGPAAQVGLQRGDVIVQLSNKSVSQSGVFRNLILRIAPGTRVHLTVVRGGQEETVEVTMGRLPEGAEASVWFWNRPQTLGMTISDLTPELATRFDLSFTAQGPVVTEVRPRGPAHEAGLRPGDVIQEVNRRPVRSARDFVEAVEQVQGGDLLVSVERGGTTNFFVIDRGG